jgi:beta-lactamase class A
MHSDDLTFDRRALLAGAGAFGLAACVPVTADTATRFGARLRIVEASANGVLGASFLDTGTGALTGHNGYARFPTLSTFKFSLAALVLDREQAGAIDGDERITWQRGDLVENSPFTTERLAAGATLRELAEATQKTSDNAAANLLMRRLGGPEALTAFWRSLGDDTSRLDRFEPALNLVPPGELRDTTTPDAMARTVAALLYGGRLDPARRALLRQWAIDTQTGMMRVRAGLPPEWIAGDKTGTSLAPGMGSVYADVGFAEPPGRAPVVFATYFRAAEQHLRIEPAAQAVLAECGRVLARFAQG